MTSLLTSADAVLTVIVPLLDEVPEAKDVHTGWWYLLVLGGLIVAMVVIWRSMRKQLGRIQFEEEPAPQKKPPAPDQDG
jgi:hypothetical protein